VLVSDHRGEAGWLPGAIRWSLSAAGLAVAPHRPVRFGYGRGAPWSGCACWPSGVRGASPRPCCWPSPGSAPPIEGGAVAPGEGYGLSSFVLMPVLAWQTKLMLDTEPDVARRLAAVAVGRRREIAAGLIASALVAVLTAVLALLLPWLFGGIAGHLH